ALPIFLADHIVGAVEPFTFKVIRENLVLAIWGYCDDCSQDTGAINQSMLPVKRISIWITERDDFFLLAIRKYTEDLVDSFVAHVDEACRDFFKFCISRN